MSLDLGFGNDEMNEPTAEFVKNIVSTLPVMHFVKTQMSPKTQI